MATAYSYACKDCEGMEACLASIAHGESPSDWTDDVREYVGTLIKTEEA